MRTLLGVTLAANGKDMANGMHLSFEAPDWKFFLKNPVYSRDYPPCKHC